MNIFTGRLVKKAIGQFTDEARADLEENIVCHPKALKNFFGYIVILGILLLFFCRKEMVVAVSLGIFFGGIGLVGFIACLNCWIRYEETEFIVSNFFGLKRTYTYDQITAMTDVGARVEIELDNNKIIRIEEDRHNRKLFRDWAYERASKYKKIQIIPPSTNLLMEDALKESYRSGTLSKAMFIPKEKYAILKYALVVIARIILGILSLLTAVMAMDSYMGFIPFVCSKIVLLFVLLLYFCCPNYCSARINQNQEKVKGRIHKIGVICPSLMGVLITDFTTLVIFAGTKYGEPLMYQAPWYVYVLPVLLMIPVFLVLRKIFYTFSREYKEYRVGDGAFLFQMILLLAFDYLALWPMAITMYYGGNLL